MTEQEIFNRIGDAVIEEIEKVRAFNSGGLYGNTIQSGFDVNVTYPYSEEFTFETFLERINLDDERVDDIKKGQGFIISDYQAIQKEVKAENGIFSPKFGQTLSDTNPFIDRYKCKCGNLKSRIYNGIECPYCGEKVRYVDDNFEMFGYLVLNNYYVIHPNLYKSIEALCGTQRLINMLEIDDQKDEDGHSVPKEKRDIKRGPHRKEIGKNEPYYGIGMVEFMNKFDEICDYYYNISSNKQTKIGYLTDIRDNRNKVFTQSIPVFTTLLRPFEISDKRKFSFESTNATYNMMSRLVTSINNDKLKIFRKSKEKNQLLFDLQVNFNALYDEIDNIISGKKGVVRQLAGGRFNFSSRDVIVQNPLLRADQVTLPYWCLVDILQQQIINVLVKTYNMSYNDAYSKWYKANIKVDEVIVAIIKGLMYARPEGLPIIINRNPSINRGSLLQMFCIDMTFTYTMALPLQILPLLAADFDGDVLNVYYIINEAFFIRSFQVLNPRNSMYISNNDGKLNSDLIPAKDTLINGNCMIRMGRGNYTPEEMSKIEFALSKKRYRNA